jgi:hypothetical protein
LDRNLPVRVDHAEVQRYIEELAKPRDYFSVVQRLAEQLETVPEEPIKIVKAGLAPPAIPAAYLPAIRDDLITQLQPASARELGKALATLEGSFKWPSEAIQSRDVYMAAMAAELRGYSYRVLSDAIQAARRHEEWLPSIATMRRYADAQARRYRQASKTLDRVEAKQRRRLAGDVHPVLDKDKLSLRTRDNTD